MLYRHKDDDVEKAMSKSTQESDDIVLSMDWKDIRSRKVNRNND